MPGTFLDIAPKILSTALITLRENAVMPKLVNADYSNDAAKLGNTIQVPVPTQMVAQDVVPGPYSQNTPDLQLDTVPIPLNYWQEAPFALTDKEMLEVMDGVPQMQIVEAARALGNAIDRSLLGLYKGVSNYVGTAGTTPFATDPRLAVTARGILNNKLASLSDRRIVLNSDAESNALMLPAFQQYLQSGTTETIRDGSIGRKFGYDWFLDQNCPTHTAGTLAGVPVTSAAPVSVTTADANNPALRNPRTVNSVAITGATNGTTIKSGDVFSVAGDPNTYVVSSDATVAGGNAVIVFSPAPAIVWATSSAVTLRASRAINLAFHRDAIALAIRPLESSQMEAEIGGTKSMTMVDPVTGIPLRLQVRSEFNRVRYALDCLWGVGLVRPQHVVVLAG